MQLLENSWTSWRVSVLTSDSFHPMSVMAATSHHNQAHPGAPGALVCKQLVHFLPQLSFVLCVCLVTESCLTLCGPGDCSPPGSSVHGILQARTEYWSELPCPLPGDLLDLSLLCLLTPSKCLSSRP